jgi:hypothetical protein
MKRGAKDRRQHATGRRLVRVVIVAVIAIVSSILCGASVAQIAPDLPPPPAGLAPFFQPPDEFAADLGRYRSPLVMKDGSVARTPADWQRRRSEILRDWHAAMGEWPPLLKSPQVELETPETRENVTQYPIKIETAPGRIVDDAYLLVPKGRGRSPQFWSSSTKPKRGLAAASRPTAISPGNWPAADS